MKIVRHKLAEGAATKKAPMRGTSSLRNAEKGLSATMKIASSPTDISIARWLTALSFLTTGKATSGIEEYMDLILRHLHPRMY